MNVSGTPLERLLATDQRELCVRHIHPLPRRAAREAPWPDWADPRLVAAWRSAGVSRPWTHQVQAAQAAWDGQHVIVTTGTASGKSLGYLLPVLTRTLRGAAEPSGRGSTALYLAPTKALAADQLAAIDALAVDGLRAACFDGDSGSEHRRWVQRHAGLVLTNPDMLHHHLLYRHQAWASFWRALRFVVVDECHHYRGVFGAHVAAVLRRVRRVAARYGSEPVFLLASATVGDPAGTAERLVGLPATVVSEDGSPRGHTELVLWEPPRRSGQGAVSSRKSAVVETAELLADLVADGVRTLAFVPSRRGAELAADLARDRLARRGSPGDRQVVTYRGGYLPEERRALEHGLRTGRLTGMVATNALELGIDVSGLDVVLICGWPGRRASLWQQVGRAGRRASDALAILVAKDDPLDTYLVHHPRAALDPAIEATVFDLDNVAILAPQLCAAAAELPLTPPDLPLFGPLAAQVVELLVQRGLLRRRPTGWFWTRPDRASDLTDLRGGGGEVVRIVESVSGTVLGTVDQAAAHHTVHPGAVYVHQGRPWVVQDLDLGAAVALVEPCSEPVSTQAREVVDLRVIHVSEERRWGEVRLCTGTVEVTAQVTSFVRRDRRTGATVGTEHLDLPARTLRTTAVWWTMPEPLLAAHGVTPQSLPGAAHAAEHAAIGVLPLVAQCDRWDVGGVSTAHHPDTGLPTIFIHDGQPGGSGFARRGFAAAPFWLRATRDVLQDCSCVSGCPACVQSPKCGNGNRPLDKAAAARLLTAVLSQLREPSSAEG